MPNHDSAVPQAGVPSKRPATPNLSGALILNADDWGRDTANTSRTLDCIEKGTVSSVSAMVFMEDSERAARIAREKGIDAGLHLNLSTAFSAAAVPQKLADHQRKVSRYLWPSRFAYTVYHPGLNKSFEYVVKAQLDEFARLFGALPQRVDGHHHMHFAANVLFGGLLPAGSIARRNFSFSSGEKSFANRAYRKALDWQLGRNHKLTDYFFSLPPLQPAERLDRMVALSRTAVVE